MFPASRFPRPSSTAARSLAWASCGFLLCSLAGCHVSENKSSDGKNVDIGTPFGSMHVKTDNNGSVNAGLTAYPGSTPVKDDGDNSAADVNLNFGDFHLGVKASSYLTADGEDKVLAFYRKDLARFGVVIECKDHAPVGQPTRTPDGLTCENEGKHVHGNVEWGDGKSDHELRAGSRTHEHIVGVERHGDGTKIGLVALDLPTSLGNGSDGKDSGN